MFCNKSSQEYFTRYSHTYTDTIKPLLTDTQRDVCDIVIRFSVGYNRDSAHISNSTFVEKSGKSERAIITAKQQLIKIGLLILLQQARSFTPALYALDIFYNDPNRSFKNKFKAVNAPQSRTIPTEAILPVISATDNLSDNTPELLPQDDDATIVDIIEDITEHEYTSKDDVVTTPELLPQDDDATIVDTVEDIPEYEYTSEEDTIQVKGNNSDGEYSQTANTSLKSVQSCTEVSSAPYTEFSSVPYRFSADLNIDLNTSTKKQTEETAATKMPTAPNVQAIRDVCYNFNSLFGQGKDKSDDSDWKFFGWAVKTYGVEVCLSKLEYIRQYRKVHAVSNPRGLFRMALMKDYQPPKFIAGMIKARRNADLAYQQSQAMLAERKIAEANYDWAAGSAALNNIIAMIDAKEREDSAHA